jgi:hypothetical protein
MSSPDYLYFARPIGVQITLGWPLSISGTWSLCMPCLFFRPTMVPTMISWWRSSPDGWLFSPNCFFCPFVRPCFSLQLGPDVFVDFGLTKRVSKTIREVEQVHHYHFIIERFWFKSKGNHWQKSFSCNRSLNLVSKPMEDRSVARLNYEKGAEG